MSFESDWEECAAACKPAFEQMHRVRERVLVKCRKTIQLCSKCIRNIHRRSFEDALQLRNEAAALVQEARTEVHDFPNLAHAGYLHDAEKEFVEASAMLALAGQTKLASAADLGVEYASYLNGMGEAASECRRFVLDEMRRGEIDRAEALMAQMEAIYDELITFDYADSLTGNLRRTCDGLRAVLERTRNDLTTTRIQFELMEELKKSRR